MMHINFSNLAAAHCLMIGKTHLHDMAVACNCSLWYLRLTH